MNNKVLGYGKVCRVLAVIALGASVGLASAAIPLGSSNVQLGGFLSQGYIASDGNNYPFTDSDGTLDFREMGINASTTVGAHLRLGGQLFAQRLGNYGGDKVKLDWAVADYNFSQEFGIRLGRVKFPQGLYGEALDLDAIRPFVFLPMSLYNPVVRDFNSAFNGGMVYGTVQAAQAGSVDYKVFYGNIPMGPDQGVADFFNTTSIYAPSGVTKLEMDYTAGAQLMWSTPINGLKAGLSYSFLENLEAVGPLAALPTLNATLRTDRYTYQTLSLEYIRDQWTFAGEWQRVGGDFQIVTPFGTSLSKSRVINWYASASRRLNDKFEVGVYYASQQNDNPAAGSPSAKNHLRDWAVSIKFDLNEHVVFKLEGHAIDGLYNVFNTLRTPNPSPDNHTTYFAAKTTLSF